MRKVTLRWPICFLCLFLSMKPISFAWLTGRHNPFYRMKSCPIWDLKRKPIKIWNCNSVLWHWQDAELRALIHQNSNKESCAFLLQPLPFFFVSLSILVCLFVWVKVSSVALPGLSCDSFASASWVTTTGWNCRCESFLLMKAFWLQIFTCLD